MGQATKTDEFSEKFQMAFDNPPPPLIFGKFYCKFLEVSRKFIRFGGLTRPFRPCATLYLHIMACVVSVSHSRFT